MEQWDRAKEGELICRMEKAIGGLPRFASIAEMLRQMDDAGVEKVFITQFASHRCFQNPSAKVATEIID